MGILDSLFSGVKALVREVITVVAEAVHVALEEIDKSSFGRAATQLVQGVTHRYFGAAEELAAEERELAAKYIRDGKRTNTDEERLQEIAAERERLRKNIDTAKSSEAANELRKNEKSVIAVPVGSDEISAAVGILASKVCPECSGTMRINQRSFDSKADKRRFYWQCASQLACPTIKLDPEKGRASVIRMRDPNLDLSSKERRAIWEREDVLAQTAGRVRESLGEADADVICPHHLLPMKLLEKPNADGLLLSTYEYVCRGVNSKGRACQYRVPLETFPQVSETLKRRDGVGIIKE